MLLWWVIIKVHIVKKVILNIGVSDQGIVLIKLAEVKSLVFKIETLHGTWNDIPEISQIVVCSIDINRIAELCSLLNEEAISVYYPEYHDGELIYNPSFTGTKTDFDVNYFNFPL